MGLPASMFVDVANFRKIEVRDIRAVSEIYGQGDRFYVDFANGKRWSFLTDRPDIFLLCFEIAMLTSATPDNFRYSEWKDRETTQQYRQRKLESILRRQ